eukprot:gene10836-biopygen8386
MSTFPAVGSPTPPAIPAGSAAAAAPPFTPAHVVVFSPAACGSSSCSPPVLCATPVSGAAPAAAASPTEPSLPLGGISSATSPLPPPCSAAAATAVVGEASLLCV